MGDDRFLGDVFAVGEVNDSCRSVPADTYRLRSIGDQRAQRADDLLMVRALAKNEVQMDQIKNTETTAAYAGKS